MPKPIEQLTTRQLVAEIDGGNYDNAEIVTEMQYRDIPDDDISESETEYRGGIRPTHLPTH